MLKELKVIRRGGFTLTEMLVVIAIVVLLATMVLPAFTEMLQSNRASAAKSLVRTMLARAQAHAVAHQKYAGIRFQFDRDGWQQGKQYMVLIEKDGSSITTFRAVADVKAITLPKGVGVLSADVIINNPVNQTEINDNNDNLDDSDLDFVPGDVDMLNLSGSTTCTIIFSPTGQLVVKDVQVRTRFQPYLEGSTVIYDTVFNHSGRVLLDSEDVGKALLFVDGTIGTGYDIVPFASLYEPQPWCYEEPSATGFYVFEVGAMGDVEADFRYSQYVQDLEPFLVNRYTAGLIDE